MATKISSAGSLLFWACFAMVTAHAADWEKEDTLSHIAYIKGDYAAAEEHDRAALDLAKSFDKNDVRREGTLTHLAAVLHTRSACCESESLLRQALAIRESRFGDESMETALGKNNLAAEWQQAGRIEEARKLQGEAIATAERLLQPNNSELIPYLALAALIERDESHYGKAEQLLKRALALAQNDPTVDSRRLMQVWRYLGSIYRAAGRFDDSEQAYKSLIALCESRFGPAKLDTANALASLGVVLCDRNFYAEARPYILRAVTIYQQINELRVPSYAASLQNLSVTELYLGQANSAEQHVLLAIDVLKNAARPDREAIGAAYNNLGQVYSTQGRFKEAAQATLQAKEIWIAAGGPESSNVANAISNLGALNVRLRKYKKAEALYVESAAMTAKISGATSLAYARELNRLGVLYNEEKHFPEAEAALRKALEIDSQKMAGNSPLLAEPYLNLAASLHRQKQRDEALECYRRGLEIMSNAGLRNTPKMAPVLDEYSALLREMDRWADAEKVSTEALGIRVKVKVNGESYR